MGQQDTAATGLEEAGFRALVAATPDILAVLDADGRVRFVNHASSRMLGRAPREMIGRPVQEFVHPEDCDRAIDSLVEDPGSAPRPSVYRLPAANGQVRHVEVASVNRLADRRLNGVCVIARDVSERWRDESERIAQHERPGKPVDRSLRLASSPEVITLEVLDDGRGTDGRSVDGKGMGLQSMAFRATSLHGIFSVRQRSEGGTQVEAKGPRSQG